MSPLSALHAFNGKEWVIKVARYHGVQVSVASEQNSPIRQTGGMSDSHRELTLTLGSYNICTYGRHNHRGTGTQLYLFDIHIGSRSSDGIERAYGLDRWNIRWCETDVCSEISHRGRWSKMEVSARRRYVYIWSDRGVVWKRKNLNSQKRIQDLTKADLWLFVDEWQNWVARYSHGVWIQSCILYVTVSPHHTEIINEAP